MSRQIGRRSAQRHPAGSHGAPRGDWRQLLLPAAAPGLTYNYSGENVFSFFFPYSLTVEESSAPIITEDRAGEAQEGFGPAHPDDKVQARPKKKRSSAPNGRSRSAVSTDREASGLLQHPVEARGAFKAETGRKNRQGSNGLAATPCGGPGSLQGRDQAVGTGLSCPISRNGLQYPEMPPTSSRRTTGVRIFHQSAHIKPCFWLLLDMYVH